MILCDIGYTNTHKNAERLHKNNIIEGIKLAEKTKDFLSGARFVSNPEKREGLIDAIKKGQLSIDASYLNLNTSICSDEELFRRVGRPDDLGLDSVIRRRYL